MVGNDAEPHVVDQLSLSVVGQCVYYRFGAGVIPLLISKADLDQHYDIETLAKHITSFSLAATRDVAAQHDESSLSENPKPTIPISSFKS